MRVGLRINQAKKSQPEDWPWFCGTSGRTRTVTPVKAPDFDVYLAPFDVARLYHHPFVAGCWALFHLAITSKLLPVIKPIRISSGSRWTFQLCWLGCWLAWVCKTFSVPAIHPIFHLSLLTGRTLYLRHVLIRRVYQFHHTGISKRILQKVDIFGKTLFRDI